jgi:hypothetical protein
MADLIEAEADEEADEKTVDELTERVENLRRKLQASQESNGRRQNMSGRRRGQDRSGTNS